MNCMRASNYFVKEPPLKEFYILTAAAISARLTEKREPQDRAADPTGRLYAWSAAKYGLNMTE